MACRVLIICQEKSETLRRHSCHGEYSFALRLPPRLFSRTESQKMPGRREPCRSVFSAASVPSAFALALFVFSASPCLRGEYSFALRPRPRLFSRTESQKTPRHREPCRSALSATSAPSGFDFDFCFSSAPLRLRGEYLFGLGLPPRLFSRTEPQKTSRTLLPPRSLPPQRPPVLTLTFVFSVSPRLRGEYSLSNAQQSKICDFRSSRS